MKNLSSIEKCIHCYTIKKLNYAYDFKYNYTFAICNSCIKMIEIDEDYEILLSKEECIKIMVLQ